ncbi:threonine/serine exporter ThrE family protein [Frigoribacterium sp. Leaf164]|uniref:threonine/serine ThrE exporter family protein n=1 Tax=Frigoribacterium sp. Leaf164 TaxID=1736282 RepID=UPI000AA92F78|nr:threonine/serine exporter family protein [Frigoribacterium sp. Leaf164]
MSDGPRAYDPPPRPVAPETSAPSPATAVTPASGAPLRDPSAPPPPRRPDAAAAVGKPAARPARQRRRRVNPQEMRDVRARLRGTIYEGTTPQHGRLGDLYSPRQIVDFCLDLGEVMLASGADVRTVEVAIVAVSTKWNLAPLELDITGTAITLQYAPAEGPPLVKMRVVSAEGSDLHRLSLVYQIVDELLHDDRDMTSAVEGLVEVLQSPPRWPSWITDGAMGLFGVSVSLQAGGSIVGAVGAFVLMIGVMTLGRWLARKGIPQFFAVVLQSACVAALGTLAIWAGAMPAGSAAAMVAAVVVLILPHVTIVTWAQDAISGFRAMAVSRALVIVLIVAGIVVGIPGGLALTSGVALEVDPTDITLRSLPIWLLLITTFFAAAATAVTQGANARVMPVAIGVAIVGTVSLWGLKQLGLPLLGATFLVAVLLGALSTVVAARLRVSATAIAVPAFCGSLLPSLAVASALLNFMAGTDGAAVDFVASMSTTLAIGAGLVLGSLLATPGARRYLRRRTKRVVVQSQRLDTSPIAIVPPAPAVPPVPPT